MQLCMRFHKNYLGYYWSLPLFDGNDRRYRKRKGQMSESEIMTIMICRQIGTCCILFVWEQTAGIAGRFRKNETVRTSFNGFYPKFEYDIIRYNMWMGKQFGRICKPNSPKLQTKFAYFALQFRPNCCGMSVLRGVERAFGVVGRTY